jgi:hypothetical protein
MLLTVLIIVYLTALFCICLFSGNGCSSSAKREYATLMPRLFRIQVELSWFSRLLGLTIFERNYVKNCCKGLIFIAVLGLTISREIWS